MRTAFIVVDVQEGYFPDELVIKAIEERSDACDVTIASRNLFPNGDPKVPTEFAKGSKWAKVHPVVKELADYVVTKGETNLGISAFEGGTLRPIVSLEQILEDEKIEGVFVGGFLLGYDLSCTAFDANALGYPTTVDLKASRPWVEESDPLVENLTRAGVEVINARA